MNPYAALLIGVLLAGIGGELFIRGIVTMACLWRISPAIVAVTFAAFATSSPELSVGINAGLAGEPEISFGDVLGSNVVNVAFILAIALVISGTRSPRDTIRRDFPVALSVPVLTGVLCLDGKLSRADGIILFVLFLAWLTATVMESRRQRSVTLSSPCTSGRWRAVMYCLAGLVCLVTAGRFVVHGARGIALSMGMDEFVVGALMVAIGTSVPELAATVIAKIRGHDEISLGTILGSNIFNGLFIVSVVALICPVDVHPGEAVTAIAFGIAAVALTWPSRDGLIRRRRGILLLILYAAYVVLLSGWGSGGIDKTGN